jgi:hypothetical protein
MHIENDPKRNASGCYDLTAYDAINNVEEREKHKFDRFMKTIFLLCEIAGYEIQGRVVFKDVRNGRIWR